MSMCANPIETQSAPITAYCEGVRLATRVVDSRSLYSPRPTWRNLHSKESGEGRCVTEGFVSSDGERTNVCVGGHHGTESKD